MRWIEASVNMNAESISTFSLQFISGLGDVASRWILSDVYLHVFCAGYEKTEDTTEKISLADQEDARLIYLNQPQFTKFCSNHVR